MFEKATGADPFDLGQKDVDEFRAATRSARVGGQARRAPRAVPRELQERPRYARLPRMAAEGVQGLPDRRRAAPPDLERRPGETLQAAGRLRRRLGADRRAEVPAVDPPVAAAERADLLLPAAPRPQRRAVVEPPELGGSLQLPVLRRGAGAFRRGGGSSVARGQEGVPLREQPLLGEVGRQRRDPEAPARAAAAWRISRGVRGSLSGSEGHREAACRRSLIPAPKPS